MPPFVPRKRPRSHSASPSRHRLEPPKKRAATTHTKGKPKPSVFDALDAPKDSPPTAEENKAFVEALNDENSEGSGLSSVDSDEFEDVPGTARHGGIGKQTGNQTDTDDENEGTWEDALPSTFAPHLHHPHGHGAVPTASSRQIEDVDITFHGAEPIPSSYAATVGKKGPTKKDREFRVLAHCMHVQFLLFHNLIRNAWVQDKEVQKILVDGLSPGLKAEVERWRRTMGMEVQGQKDAKTNKSNIRGKCKKGRRSNGKEKADGQNIARDRIRDWGAEAARLESGAPDLSRGDPLPRLLRYLAAYWKKKFIVTAPGLRKRGYMPPAELAEEVRSFKQGEHDIERHGEKVESLEQFRELARKCQGSRDVGAQLFTALLRGLGLDARMVASLQPVGFGWNKFEEANSKKKGKSKKRLGEDAVASTALDSDGDNPPHSTSRRSGSRKVPKAKGGPKSPVDVDASDSALSSALSDLSDADSIPMTPSKPKPSRPKYDADMFYPTYWTEVLSPVSKKYIPVSTLTNPVLATQPADFKVFEPRGAKADAARLVFCYLIAFSSDGTAKDVTTRYLSRNQWPGRTKGVRMPPEKIPVYNKRGKVLRYETYDWFKRVMRPFARPEDKRTQADDVEDEGDLVPAKREKKDEKKGEETLQGYKTSAEFVLERHLRREEAILPTANSVKTFKTGKGEKVTEEPVFKRKDVVVCKTTESWHKEGRVIKAGVEPLKHVPIRAVTIIRKREVEEQMRETGEKPTQGLYSKAQTEWIIPPPIKDGRIPRNTFGNIDVYVPSMVPRGAVHLRLKGAARVCKRLGIDYAEACTGFEFGKQRAVPVITGVVVAEENEDAVRDAWRAEEVEKKKNEDDKREKLVLVTWKKFLGGLKILERVKREYGNVDGENFNPFTKKKKPQADDKHAEGVGTRDPENSNVEETGGGFLPESGPDEDASLAGGGVLPDSEDEEHQGGGFLLEQDDNPRHEPKSLTAMTNGITNGNVSLPPYNEATSGDEDDEHVEQSLSPEVIEEEKKPRGRGRPRESGPEPTKPLKAPKRPTPAVPKSLGKRTRLPGKKTAKNARLSIPSDSEHSVSVKTSADEISEPVPKRKRTKAVTNGGSAAATPAGGRPKRQAARNSAKAVRSHYFQHSSDDED